MIHTIVENLIKIYTLEAAKILLSENDYQKLESISLSDNTVSRRIDDIGMYIKSELYSRLHQVNIFCLQIDESTDVTGLAVLLTFVSYVDNEKICFYAMLLTSFTIREEILKILDLFMNENKIP